MRFRVMLTPPSIRSRPWSSRFPYTTLFRSIFDEIREPIVRATVICPKEYVGAVMGLCHERRGRVPSRHPRDRKSTRLNSSHSQTSYALLCLKQKSPTSPATHDVYSRLILAQ